MTKKTPEFLTEAVKFGINPGLGRINRLCEILGNPQKDLHVIHIAGTNGKGSASAFASSMLASSGLKVGVYTSPYLERFSERIRIIDGCGGLQGYMEDDSYGEIPDDVLSELSELVKKAAKQTVDEGIEHPTEFELVTAICFKYFSDEKVDIAVMETGLGGRLDSTNVFADPVASVITSVGMDHMEILGDTIGKIAYEKARIFKKGCPAFCLNPSSMILTEEQAEEAGKTLVREAASAGCSLEFVTPRTDTIEYTDNYTMKFKVDCLDGRYVETSLLGDHQCGNCTLAALAVTEAAKIWPQITADTCIEGIRDTVWKCRAEIINKDPLVILDGGHNPQGAESFADVYGKIDGGRTALQKARLVISVMRDKDIEGIITRYRDGGIDIAEVWPVRVANPRTADPGELYNIIKQVYNRPVGRGGSDVPEEAVRLAFEESKKDNMPLIVTGSLYLLGQVRGVIKRLI